MKFLDLGTMEALREHVLAHGCYSSEENLRIFQKWFLERPPLTFLGTARKYGITSKRLCDVGCAYGGMLVYSAPGSYGIEIEPYEVRFAKSIGLEVIDCDIVADVLVWSKYSNAQRVSSLHLSKGRLKVLSNWAGV